jgi:hypothetical protein
MTHFVARTTTSFQHDRANETLARIPIVPEPMVGRELRTQRKSLVQMHTVFAFNLGLAYRIELLHLVVSGSLGHLTIKL